MEFLSTKKFLGVTGFCLFLSLCGFLGESVSQAQDVDMFWCQMGVTSMCPRDRSKPVPGECSPDFFQALSDACGRDCVCEIGGTGRETKCRSGKDTFLIDCEPKNGAECFCAEYHPSK